MNKLLKDQALVVALVRGLAFAAITFIYTLLAPCDEYLWAVYIGFFLTMAFGVKIKLYKSYVCSYLIGYLWATLYIGFPKLLQLVLPHIAAVTISECILTFLLLYIHLKYLHRTVFNKIPAVFAGVTTVFVGGINYMPMCAMSAVIGISMAIGTEIVIQKILKR